MYVLHSGGGTVDFQEFVGGLSAFSSRGGRDEKLRCKLSLSGDQIDMSDLYPLPAVPRSCFQSVRYRPRWFYIKR